MASPSSPAQHDPHVTSRSALPVLSIVAFCLLLAATLYAVVRHGAAPRTPRTSFDVSTQAPQGPSWPTGTEDDAAVAMPPSATEPLADPVSEPLADPTPASPPEPPARSGESFTAPAVPVPPDGGLDAGPDAMPSDTEPPPAAAAPTNDAGGDAAAVPLAPSEATLPCGATLCAPGKLCCNESCGTCVNPGESCSKVVCGMSAVPGSASCGQNTCNVGEICCNPSCGICVSPGETCDQRRCPNEIQALESESCGMQTCNIGFVCCNASCGVCKRPGEDCVQAPCT